VENADTKAEMLARTALQFGRLSARDPELPVVTILIAVMAAVS